MASLFVLNLVLTLLGWAFALSPFTDNRAMGQISAGLEHFYRAFTSPGWSPRWSRSARRGSGAGSSGARSSATIAGTLVSVALMVGALVVIHEPQGTVGKVSDLSNKAAQAVIAAPQGGSISDPVGSYAATTARVWNAMTLPGFSRSTSRTSMGASSARPAAPPHREPDRLRRRRLPRGPAGSDPAGGPQRHPPVGAPKRADDLVLEQRDRPAGPGAAHRTPRSGFATRPGRSRATTCGRTTATTRPTPPTSRSRAATGPGRGCRS